MKRCLVLNPNTTEAVTELVLGACRDAQPGVEWEGRSARFGAAYIADEVAYAKASHAVIDAYEAYYAGHDAVFVACFGDPGLLAVRQLSPVPVMGLAQASLQAAARRGRFAVVTGGHAWQPMLERFMRAHQLDERLVGIHTVELTGAQIAAEPERALDDLTAAARRGIGQGAEVILLGGAALYGLSAQLQPRLTAPVLDNVLLAAQAVADAVA